MTVVFYFFEKITIKNENKNAKKINNNNKSKKE